MELKELTEKVLELLRAQSAEELPERLFEAVKNDDLNVYENFCELVQDLDRIYTLRELGFWPYVMVYERETLPKGHELRRLQRWVNMRAAFESTPKFEDYKP